MVVTTLNLHYFERLFSEIDVGRHGMISVRRTDSSRLVVRWPVMADRMNNEAKDIPPQKQIESGVSEGVVRYAGRTDGQDRIFAFKRVAGYPFYILVGRNVDEQFAGWLKTTFLTSAFSIMALSLLGVFLQRLKKSETRLQKSEAQYRAVVENQTDAVCRWTPDTRLTFANTIYRELFGFADKASSRGPM